MNFIVKAYRWFLKRRLKNKLWEAANQLICCGQDNLIEVQHNINKAKDRIYDALWELNK